MAKNAAPPRTSRGFTHSKAFAKNFATTDLTAQASKPAHAPQLVDIKNEGAAAATAVLLMQDGSTFTKVLTPGQEYPVESPVDSLMDTSDADVSAVAHWEHGNSIPFNPAP